MTRRGHGPTTGPLSPSPGPDDRDAARAARPASAAPVSPPPDPRYDRAERVADAAIHVTGLALALMAAPVLITLAALLDGTGPVIAGVSVYGAGMLLMLGASAAYHLAPAPTWRDWLRRLDHAAIYLKIAATQTPFAVLVGGAGAAWVLGSVWLAALGGAAAKLFWPGRLRRLTTPVYLGLGWAGAALFVPWEGADALALATVVLVAVGGLLYSAGVVFLLAERLRFHNAIWHGFVLAATFVFYAAVTTEVGLRAAAAASAAAPV